MERRGIEPRLKLCKSYVLPLNERPKTKPQHQSGERDSNSRRHNVNGFADRLLKPLGHRRTSPTHGPGFEPGLFSFKARNVSDYTIRERTPHLTTNHQSSPGRIRTCDLHLNRVPRYRCATGE